MKAGMAATGTEMSCLIEAPSRFWASEMLSRMCQKLLRLGFVLRHDRIAHQLLRHGVFQRRLRQSLQAGARAARHFHQHIPGRRLGQRIAGAGNMLQHQFQRRGAIPVQRPTAGRRCGPACGPADSTPRRARATAANAVTISAGRANRRKRRRRDDAQRAFRADENLLQVVAGIVLVQAFAAWAAPARPPAPLPAPAPAPASCHSAAHDCRRHWWRYCRRWCRSLPRPG